MKNLVKLLMICAVIFSNKLISQNILLSAEPFSASTQHKKDFKAGSNIYARITTNKTLKDYAVELDAWGLNNVKEDGLEGIYTNCLIIEIKDQNSGKENKEPNEIKVYLSASDLNKNQLDIDISPDEDQAKMYVYGPRGTFFNQFASIKDDDNYIGKVINFQLVLNQYKKNEKVSGESGGSFSYNDAYSKINEKTSPMVNFTIDYTASTKQTQKNWYNEQESILDATRKKIIEKYKNELTITPVANVSKTIKESIITFSSKPFSKNGPIETEFKPNGPIYGQLKFTKAIKNYCKKLDAYDLSDKGVDGKYSHSLVFEIDGVNADLNNSHTQVTLYLKTSDLEKNTIDFDVLPDEDEASTFFGSGFYNGLTKGGDLYNYHGKKTEMVIRLVDDEKGTKTVLGSLIMDYTASDYSSLMNNTNGFTETENKIHSKYKK